MKMLGIIGACALGLLVGVIAVGPSVAEYYAFQKFPANERAQVQKEYQDWKSKKLHLPDEALTPPAFSPATRAAAQAFLDQWEKHREQALKVLDNGNAPPDPAVVAKALPDLAPMIDAFVAVVGQPDYTACAIAHPAREKVAFDYNYLSLQTNAKLLKYRALDQARHGQMDKALESAETIVRATRASRYDTLISQLVGIAIGHLGTLAWNDIIRECNDPKLLRQSLEHQNKLAPGLEAFITSARENSITVIDLIGMLRELKGKGFVSFSYQDLTAKELAARASEAQAAYLEQALAEAKKDPQQYAAMLQSMESAKISAAMYGGRAYTLAGSFRKLSGRFTLPFMYRMMKPNYDECYTRANTLRTKFDLLRLETARKLYTLEKGKAPEKLADLVPGYLPELPTDRFATKAAQPDQQETCKETYKESKDAFYSIGPDRKDNLNAISYDPSNGTFSAGDVALGR